MWNLYYLFTPTSWMWTFISIGTAVTCLKLATFIGTKFGMSTFTEEITLFPYRIRLLSQFPTDDIFPRGFSHNSLFFWWAIFGGFLNHCLLCNLLTTILKPQFEKMMDSPADLVEYNITMVLAPGAIYYKYLIGQSPVEDYQHLGKYAYVSSNFSDLEKVIREDILTEGKAAFMNGYLGDFLESWGRWHRTKELIEGFYPYGGWYGGKKWHDFDICAKHIMHFQQMGLIQKDVEWVPWEWSEELVVLTMEHFALGFMILGGGILLALISFIFELCLKGKSSKKEKDEKK